MQKLFNDHAKELFARELAVTLPQFKFKKSLRSSMPGAARFEYRVDASRFGWVAFGGFKDTDFSIIAAWTVSGRELRELPEWEQYPNPRAFVVPPIPPDGQVDLRDRWRFESSDAGAWYSLSLGTPPLPFATRIFENYVNAPEFEEQCQRMYEGAKRIYTKNLPTFEQVKRETREAELVLCKNVWAHLGKRHNFSVSELNDVLRPIVVEAVTLVKRNGYPLIQKQLGEAA